MKIPILNIYYLLCYAWDHLEEKGVVDVDIEGSKDLKELFARVLVSGTRYLIKRGLDRQYVAETEIYRGVKGKINFCKTLKRQLLLNAKLCCEYSELKYNVLHNQIIKTTIHQLIISGDLPKDLNDDLVSIFRALNEIDEIPLRPTVFSQVNIHRNNSFYRFLMNICEMIYHVYFVTEKTAAEQFADFLRDRSAMARLFEVFVKNFYKKELLNQKGDFLVKGAETINWDAVPASQSAGDSLPVMRTDISIRTPERYYIIDTKYYEKALQTYHKSTVRSAHLYQIFAYLKNIESRGYGYESCNGILLYPTVEYDLDLEYEIQGHRVSVKTVNLAKEWPQIHDRLIEIINE